MSSHSTPIAVIADPHFHDLAGDYGVSGVLLHGKSSAIRPFAQGARSTRLFNESAAALRHALDDVVSRGIRHVVLLGDYSDDGQVTTLEGLRRLIENYAGRGIKFFALPGNHDIFGPEGRHRAKRFMNADGGHDLVTSDVSRAAAPDDDRVVVWPGMYCLGYPAGLEALPGLGFFPGPDALHWETPFGTGGAPADRMYSVTSPDGSNVRRLMDASYLVEPFDGVWMLMIDANVFVPRDGPGPFSEDQPFEDSTDAGWSAMLRHKPFMFAWMKDVAERARALGKRLLAFSHYPVLDPLDGTRDDEIELLGHTSMVCRTPDVAVGKALIECGVIVHFSGHLHLNDTARMTLASGSLINIAVPSLVAFPGAYKIVTANAGRVDIETVEIGGMKLDAELMALYRKEAGRSGMQAQPMLDATNYGEFLHAHLGHLAVRRHLKREWPASIADALRSMNLGDIALLGGMAPKDADRLGLGKIPAAEFLGDWYRVRMGSELGIETVDAVRREAYAQIADLYRDRKVEPGLAHAFKLMLRMYERYLGGLPSKNISIEIGAGRINRVS